MFAWSYEKEQQHQQQQQQHDLADNRKQQQQQQQQSMFRTGAVVLALQGPVVMELLVAQVGPQVARLAAGRQTTQILSDRDLTFCLP
jgi:hypothetical protein